MMRKLTLLGLLLALCVSFGVVSAQDTTTVRYFTFSAAPDHLKDLDAIVQGFKQENPGIDVAVETAPFADYITLLQADVVSGDAPDVFELNYENFLAFADNGALLDLSASLDASAPYSPGALAAFQLDGKQYALPESFSTVLLFYNADLFDQAEVAYPTAEWTWDDAMKAAKAIRALGSDIWGIYSPIQFWEFYKKAAQNGECQFFNADQTESTINSPACVQTLELMTGFLTEDVMPSAEELSGVANEDLFLSGKLGMDVIGIWQFEAFKEAPFKWDIQLEPGINQKAHHFFANGVAVSATSKNAEAASKWAQYLTSSKTAATVRVASGWELPALKDPSYVADYLKLTPPATRQAVFDALDSAVNAPTIKRQAEFQDIVNGVLTQVAEGQLSAQDGLTQAKEQIDALLK